VKFGFIRQQMKAYPITVLCAVMEVSRSGFYHYLHRLNTDNAEFPQGFKKASNRGPPYRPL